MISKWYEYKEKALILRRAGNSIKSIEKRLGIPRSTLSGWFKNVELSSKQIEVLKNNWKEGLVRGRKKAIIWHNKQKADRIELANIEARKTLSEINIKDLTILDLALSMLYFGEGFKKSSATGIGNSDPLILRFFIKIINKIYNIQISKMRCELHLRADQDPNEIKRYWAKELGIPIEQFKQVSVDNRTIGKSTYSYYKGVCIVNCGTVAIQRKLIYLSRSFCEKAIESLGG